MLKAARYPQAADRYTQAISKLLGQPDSETPPEVRGPLAILLSNRSQALIKIESYGTAIADADEAIAQDPSYIKAYFRRGSANYALSKFKLAKADFNNVLKRMPGDAAATKLFKECDKRLKEEQFVAAMGYGDPVEDESNQLNQIASIPLDLSKYDGPVLPHDAEGKPVVSMDFVKECIEHLKAQKLLHRKFVCELLVAARSMFKALPSLLRVPLPALPDGSGTGTVTVCGDTHGQYYDLLNIFEIGGFPSEINPYLFNGDFVDRGSFSFENVMTLILVKLACPAALHMTRGNHETKNMNKLYGFEGEVLHKYDQLTMNLFTQVFQQLPLATVIQDAVFVVHGGLSTEGNLTLENVSRIPRGTEPPEQGLMSDLLWADPQPLPGRAPSKRGVGWAFGPDYTTSFLERNGLQLLVRSHEVKDEGYVEEHNGKCITIFSAPNYWYVPSSLLSVFVFVFSGFLRRPWSKHILLPPLPCFLCLSNPASPTIFPLSPSPSSDQMGNKGAFIRFSADMVPRFTKFDAVPHPPVAPMRYANNAMFGF